MSNILLLKDKNETYLDIGCVGVSFKLCWFVLRVASAEIMLIVLKRCLSFVGVGCVGVSFRLCMLLMCFSSCVGCVGVSLQSSVDLGCVDAFL